MRKQIDPMLKTKLYLLTIGILILAVLLVKTKEEPQKQPEKQNRPRRRKRRPRRSQRKRRSRRERRRFTTAASGCF